MDDNFAIQLFEGKKVRIGGMQRKRSTISLWHTRTQGLVLPIPDEEE
jgi:hypothetical protein